MYTAKESVSYHKMSVIRQKKLTEYYCHQNDNVTGCTWQAIGTISPICLPTQALDIGQFYSSYWVWLQWELYWKMVVNIMQHQQNHSISGACRSHCVKNKYNNICILPRICNEKNILTTSIHTNMYTYIIICMYTSRQWGVSDWSMHNI